MHLWIIKAQRGTKTPAHAKYGRNHSGMYRDGSIGRFKYGQNDNFIRECPKNKESNGKEGNIACLFQVLHQIELHLDELI